MRYRIESASEWYVDLYRRGLETIGSQINFVQDENWNTILSVGIVLVGLHFVLCTIFMIIHALYMALHKRYHTDGQRGGSSPSCHWSLNMPDLIVNKAISTIHALLAVSCSIAVLILMWGDFLESNEDVQGDARLRTVWTQLEAFQGPWFLFQYILGVWYWLLYYCLVLRDMLAFIIVSSGGGINERQVALLRLVGGYFMYDIAFESFKALEFFWYLVESLLAKRKKRRGKLQLSMFLHHVITFVGVTYALTLERSGLEMILATVVTEISTPLLNMRYVFLERRKKFVACVEALENGGKKCICEDIAILKDAAKKAQNYEAKSAKFFGITFLFWRLFPGTLLVLATCLKFENPIFLRLLSFGLYCVSLYWSYIIAILIKGGGYRSRVSR